MKKILLLVTTALIIASCSKDDKDDDNQDKYKKVTPVEIIGEWMCLESSNSYYLNFQTDTTGMYLKTKGTSEIEENFRFKYQIKDFQIKYTTLGYSPKTDSCGIAVHEGDLIFAGKTYSKFTKE